MPGRGDAYEKYLETFEHWRLRGWSVTAADWRGQAGSGRLGSGGEEPIDPRAQALRERKKPRGPKRLRGRVLAVD